MLIQNVHAKAERVSICMSLHESLCPDFHRDEPSNPTHGAYTNHIGLPDPDLDLAQANRHRVQQVCFKKEGLQTHMVTGNEASWFAWCTQAHEFELKCVHVDD